MGNETMEAEVGGRWVWGFKLTKYNIYFLFLKKWGDILIKWCRPMRGPREWYKYLRQILWLANRLRTNLGPFLQDHPVHFYRQAGIHDWSRAALHTNTGKSIFTGRTRWICGNNCDWQYFYCLCRNFRLERTCDLSGWVVKLLSLLLLPFAQLIAVTHAARSLLPAPVGVTITRALHQRHHHGVPHIIFPFPLPVPSSLHSSWSQMSSITTQLTGKNPALCSRLER